MSNNANVSFTDLEEQIQRIRVQIDERRRMLQEQRIQMDELAMNVVRKKL
jgi:hypothetical protein